MTTHRGGEGNVTTETETGVMHNQEMLVHQKREKARNGFSPKASPADFLPYARETDFGPLTSITVRE